ncbi:MAG: hypothetical protein Q6370_021230 [Candidatus Sigynarchaeota archaeon]
MDAAAEVVNILRAYSKKLHVIVPLDAKSAVTLIAICADKLFLCKAGKLGPIDPQVRHSAIGWCIPVSSITDALHFVESTDDLYIKMTMADKLDPFLIGAYNPTIKQVKQYVQENLKRLKKEDGTLSLQKKDVDELVRALTEEYAVKRAKNEKQDQ